MYFFLKAGMERLGEEKGGEEREGGKGKERMKGRRAEVREREN